MFTPAPAGQLRPSHTWAVDVGIVARSRQTPAVTDQPAATRSFGRSEIQGLAGDITQVAADAIVNAANSAFAHGGRVDGAIRAAAGPELSGEMRRRYPSGTPTGTAVATDAYALPARWVIHAVGPVWGLGGRTRSTCWRRRI